MSYYNNPTSPPVAPRSTKPGYSTTSNSANNFVAATPTYISSPFDDDPVPQNHNHGYEKDPYNNPYNPDYMPTYNNNQSTHEHALSPGFTEKALAGSGPTDHGGQTYAMQHLSGNNSNPYDNNNNNYQYNNNNNSPYNNNNNYNRESFDNPHYYNGYDEDRPSLSNDTAPMRPHKDLESSEGLTRGKSGVSRIKYGKEKSKCLYCFPCIRSTCGRVTCCICLLLILAIIALAIVIVTMFKVPSVNYLGMQGDPVFSYNQGSTFAVDFTANIEVKNPNPIGFYFESIVATAYYPNYGPSIGGGNVTKVDFPKQSTKTIPFTISAKYNSAQDEGFTVVRDILTRCGLQGGPKQQLTINYDLKLTLNIIGINISPTIKNQHANFDCPNDIDQIAQNIPGGIGAILGGK
ncbi:hypothetical protein BGZ51_000502 [Haplosporangium sp. Z 767]|nr:hypothetical protein BGZ51_000502 [Haplosporangium sp. Z 767]KAF9190781.1 hypothetical protein BGZ50_009832 [Haplosporangium sp. Z 11]